MKASPEFKRAVETELKRLQEQGLPHQLLQELHRAAQSTKRASEELQRAAERPEARSQKSKLFKLAGDLELIHGRIISQSLGIAQDAQR
jgi:hypothetical protein